jgi:hypothetical protein
MNCLEKMEVLTNEKDTANQVDVDLHVNIDDWSEWSFVPGIQTKIKNKVFLPREFLYLRHGFL